MHNVKTGVAAVILGLTTAWLWPMAVAAETPRTITVSGQGSVSAPPDMATITIGVTAQAEAARDAMQETSQAVSALLARLTDLGIAPADIQTQRITVNPVWSDRRTSEQPPQITGFTASNALLLKVRTLPDLGPILDQVMAEGANEFNGLRFNVQNPKPLVDAARQAAVADAMDKAQLYATAAGVQLGALQSLSEQGGTPRPVMMEMAAARDASVPIAEGEVSVTASVTMVFAIAE
ncbi:MAG: SIMPL domain-containing protein [Pseudomonadota bacterium]